MTRRPNPLIVIIAVVLAVLGGRAISAQDKYTVQVPNGLAFSDGHDPARLQSAASQIGDSVTVLRGDLSKPAEVEIRLLIGDAVCPLMTKADIAPCDSAV